MCKECGCGQNNGNTRLQFITEGYTEESAKVFSAKMKAQLHLAGLFVIHGCAQLIISNEFVVGAAERIENTAVVRREFAPRHGSAREKAYSKTEFEIERAEEKDHKAKHRTDDAGYQSGNNGIVFCGTVNQIRLCFIHGTDERERSEEIKDELPAEQIKKNPAADKNCAGEHYFHFHKKPPKKYAVILPHLPEPFKGGKPERIQIVQNLPLPFICTL